MSLTAQVSSTDVAFKLSQKIVSSLAEKFSFKFEDGWNAISSRSIEAVQKRLKRERRKANPTSAIKHSRTSFSYFTQRQRPLEQAAHPEATFGQLSRYVSEKWKALTPEQMAEFKELEAADKVRYQNERASVLAATPAVAEASASSEGSEVSEGETSKPAKVKAPKADKAAKPAKVEKAPKAEKAVKVVAPASTPAESTPVAKNPKAEKPKTPKAAAPAVATPVAEAATPAAKVEKVKAPKVEKPKTPKAETAAPAVAAPVEAAPKVAKAPSAPKAAKAVKA